MTGAIRKTSRDSRLRTPPRPRSLLLPRLSHQSTSDEMRVSPLDLKILVLTPVTEVVDEVEAEVEAVDVVADVAATAEIVRTTKVRMPAVVTEVNGVSADTRVISTTEDLMTVNLEADGRVMMKARRMATGVGATTTSRRVLRRETSRASKSRRRPKLKPSSRNTSLVITKNLRRKKSITRLTRS